MSASDPNVLIMPSPVFESLWVMPKSGCSKRCAVESATMDITECQHRSEETLAPKGGDRTRTSIFDVARVYSDALPKANPEK